MIKRFLLIKQRPVRHLPLKFIAYLLSLLEFCTAESITTCWSCCAMLWWLDHYVMHKLTWYGMNDVEWHFICGWLLLFKWVKHLGKSEGKTASHTCISKFITWFLWINADTVHMHNLTNQIVFLICNEKMLNLDLLDISKYFNSLYTI